jgi:hypothetical protein
MENPTRNPKCSECKLPKYMGERNMQHSCIAALRFLIDEIDQRLYERIKSDTSKRFEENESNVNRCLNAFTSYSGDARKMKEMVDDIK